MNTKNTRGHTRGNTRGDMRETLNQHELVTHMLSFDNVGTGTCMELGQWIRSILASEVGIYVRPVLVQ